MVAPGPFAKLLLLAGERDLKKIPKRMLAKLIQIYHDYINEMSDSHRCWHKTAYVKRLAIRSSYALD
jgi:hypothetical protein